MAHKFWIYAGHVGRNPSKQVLIHLEQFDESFFDHGGQVCPYLDRLILLKPYMD
jgi:hypothetical protein